MPAPQFDTTYARLPEHFFARVLPSSAPNPKLLALNQQLANDLGLDLEWLTSPNGLAMLSGKAMPAAADPIAMAYAGHQFGGWSPQLGDGRAHLLGEVIDRHGHRYDIQLKGSGQTPFSRRGDGKAAIGPVMREYIVSEAMFALGVPTSRSLAAVISGERVQRETALPGAILTRVASSHIRVGTFQYFYARQDKAAIKVLADYVIDRHYPQAKRAANPYSTMLQLIAENQARLIAKWMQLGFIHGVMNTDNMAVSGETIDYGPCAFMDDFHPQKVFSSIDETGRYSWVNQPNMAHWNLARLGEALLPVIADDQEQAVTQAEAALAAFSPLFDASLTNGFLRKLGFGGATKASNPARKLIETSFQTMTENHVDFTLFYRRLNQVAAGEDAAGFLDLFDSRQNGEDWLTEWRRVFEDEPQDQEERLLAMQAVNPIIIPRNHQVEKAIVAGQNGDFEPFHQLVEVLKEPFQADPAMAKYEAAPELEEIVQRTFCGT